MCISSGMEKEKLLSFTNLGLSSWLTNQCLTMGLKTPTPIQENCIPKILAGFDCIGCAKTGSGKTLTFALPILQKLCENMYGVFTLILTPTRELAYQIGEQFAVCGKMINLRCSVVTGGVEMIQQAAELSRKPHVVIATPGRLADHLRSCDTFSLKMIKFLVIDEADRLLGGRFNEDLVFIFDALPKCKQILMFSATLTDSIERAKCFASDKVFVWNSNDNVATVDGLKQCYVLCPHHARDGYLVQTMRSFLSENDAASIMIFTDTCKNSQLLSMMLNEVGFENSALHGILTQKQRLLALAKFKSRIVRILIATDVASRGLDIPAVSLVINHFVPNDYKIYVHRVGRTARAGRNGLAISLISPHEIGLMKSIEKHINFQLEEYIVCDREVANILVEVKVTMREAEIKLDETDFEEKKLTNKMKNLISQGRDPHKVRKAIKQLQQKKAKRKLNRHSLTK